MDFGLSDEQLALQATARRFAREQVAPIAAQHDRTGEFPREVIRKAWELGLSSTVIPVEYGGVGLSSLDSCLVTEEIAWGCAGIATSVMCNDLGLTPILVAGSPEQKRDWLRPCAEQLHAGLLLPVRAGRRLGRRGTPAARREGRRRTTG